MYRFKNTWRKNTMTKFIDTVNDDKRATLNTSTQAVDITKVIKLKGTFNYKKQMYKILNEMIENQVQIRDMTNVIRLSTKVNFDIYSFTV